MFFSVINKNSNWEILTKNLVTFKEKDGVKKLSYFWKEGSGVFEGGLIPQYTLCFIFLFLQFYKEHIRSIYMECRRHKNFRRPEERKTYRW